MKPPRRSQGPAGTLLLIALILGVGVAMAAPPAAAQSRGKGSEDGKQGDEGQDLEGPEVRTVLGLMPPEARRNEQRQWEIRCQGRAQLPDGTELGLSLHYALPENDPIDRKVHVRVQGGLFGTPDPIVFGPYDPDQMAHGHYWVIARYRYADQPDPEVQKNFRTMFPGAEEWKRYVDCSDRKAVFLGTRAQEQIQDAKRREYYLETSERIIDLMNEFDEALVSALQVGFDDATDWEEYVVEKGLLRDEGDDLDEKLDELRKRKEFVTGGKLDTEVWRDFLDRDPATDVGAHPLDRGGLRGRIARVIHDHDRFARSRLGGKLPKADERILEMATSLYDLTMLWSRNLYRVAGVSPRHPADVRPQDPVRIVARGSHARILSLARSLEKEVEFRLPEE